MNGMLVVFALSCALILLSLIFMYNGLIRKKNAVDNAFGGIDAQLKKRYDVIPNLVATVQQYAEHESGVLGRITALRAKAMGGTLSNDEKVVIDNELSSSLRSVLITVENYPTLTNTNFFDLQRALNEVEAQISAARRAYNAAVTDYNNGIESFPTSIMARRMKLQPKEVFAIPDTERVNVDVHNLFKRS